MADLLFEHVVFWGVFLLVFWREERHSYMVIYLQTFFYLDLYHGA